MSNWTSGYVSDIDYTFGYYPDLNPTRIQLALLASGYVPPKITTACELGFGQGISVNMHACASQVRWIGTDFNPTQAGFAQELASACHSGAMLYDDSFEAFSKRDLPEFDYIGLHGIWSWISDENRSVIVDFIQRKLKVGGVLYISYNTLPGWSAFAPIRHLMTQHSQIEGADGAGIVSRINGAIDFAEKLLSVNPAFSRMNPQVSGRIEKLKGLSRQYIAHEYFNAEWEPMYFSDMSQWLSDAKLNYACSANMLESVEALNLTKEQSEFLKDVTDVVFRETTRDFLVNQQFRKDYWIKGARKIDSAKRFTELRSMNFVLTVQPSSISLKISTLAGEANLNESVYKPIISLMSDFKIRSIAEIESALKAQGLSLQKLIQSMVVLVSLGYVHVAQPESEVTQRHASTQALNTHLMSLARSTGDISFLASPVTGGGHGVPRFHQLFLLARQEGHKTPVQWAEFAWMWLKAQGQSLLKDGQPLKTE